MQVGRHVRPSHEDLPRFMARFELLATDAARTLGRSVSVIRIDVAHGDERERS